MHAEPCVEVAIPSSKRQLQVSANERAPALEFECRAECPGVSCAPALAGELDISRAEQLHQAVSKLLAEDGAAS